MATFGVDQAITALTLAYKLAVKLREEAEEIEAVEKAMRRVKNELVLLKARMSDSNSGFNTSDNRIREMLKEDISDIKSGVAEVQKILHLREKIPWWEWGSRSVFVVTQIPKLKALVVKFDACTTNIDKVIAFIVTDVLKGVAMNDAKEKKAAEIRAKKQAELMEKLLVEQKAAREDARKAKTRVDLLLALVKEKGTKAVQDVAMQEGAGDAEGWVKELVQGGVENEAARRDVEDTLKAIKRATTMEMEKKKFEENKKADAKRKAAEKKKAEEQKKAEDKTKANMPATSSPPLLTPGKKPAIIVPVTEPKNLITKDGTESILCVDDSNGPCSIISHIYLNFLRSWTIDVQKCWLFNHVDSIGIGIPTNFSRAQLPPMEASKRPQAGQPPSKEAVAVIAGGPSYFKSRDPDEKAVIIDAMNKFHRSSGLEISHFKNFRHIICYDEATRKLLQTMRTEALKHQTPSSRKVIAQIHQLKSTEWFGSCKAPGNAELEKVMKQLRIELKAFLAANFSWENPAKPFASGEWRTLQFFIAGEIALKARFAQPVRKDIEKATGTRIFVVPTGRDDWVLVSVSGPQARLYLAQKSILDL